MGEGVSGRVCGDLEAEGTYSVSTRRFCDFWGVPFGVRVVAGCMCGDPGALLRVGDSFFLDILDMLKHVYVHTRARNSTLTRIVLSHRALRGGALPAD